MNARSSLQALASVVVSALVLGACAPGPRPDATAAAIPRVALLHVGTDHEPPSLNTLVARLAELGWIDGSQDDRMGSLVRDGRIRGERIELIWRNLERDEVEAQALALVAERVDVIVAFEDRSIAAAQAATSEP